MIGDFTTREIATIFWITILIALIIKSKKMRPSLINVVKAAFAKPIVVSFTILTTYLLIILWIFSLFNLNIWEYLKDILIWFLFVGIPFAYSSIDQKKTKDKKYFINYVINNIKIIAIIEFIVSTFTFNLVVEIIMFPALTILVIIDTYASRKKEYASVQKLSSALLMIIGILILYNSLKLAINSYYDYGIENLLVSFILPFILSILYCPITYTFVIYAEYETLFKRLKFATRNNEKYKDRKYKILKNFKLSYKKIVFFRDNYQKYFWFKMTDEDFETMINLTNNYIVKDLKFNDLN